MLTPEDIVNPARKSGFAHVNANGPERSWRAEAGANGNPGRPDYKINFWRGRTRQTPLEAAQDYCDYVNSGRGVAIKPAKAHPPKPSLNLQRAHHPRRATATEGPKGPTKRLTAAGRAARTVTQGFVYLIGITNHAEYVKVGWSSRAGFPRLNELQTGNPLLLVGEAEFPGTLLDEYNLHAAHEPENVLNEWFLATPDLLSEFDLTWFEHCLLVHDTNGIDGGSP